MKLLSAAASCGGADMNLSVAAVREGSMRKSGNRGGVMRQQGAPAGLFLGQ
jgi:hypothetical protein